MSAPPADDAAREVLTTFPALGPPAPPQPLGNRGGFSGARLWRVQAAAGPVCLRAWPAAPEPARLDFVHRLMSRARAAGLGFVPPLFACEGGRTWLPAHGRLWEVAGWLPG